MSYVAKVHRISECKCPQCGNHAEMDTTIFMDEDGKRVKLEKVITCQFCDVVTIVLD